MEDAVQKIKMAMANSLSLNEQLRNEAQDFLTKQCEPIPQYQQVLLHIIASYSRQTAQSTQSDQMVQYQAILFMKNSLTKLLSMHRSMNRYTRLMGQPSGQSTISLFTSGIYSSTAKGSNKEPGALGNLQITLQNLSGSFPPAVNQQQQLTTEFLEDLKAKILSLIQNPDDCILCENAYNQLTLVACIFVKQDFPSSWPQLNQWLLQTFDDLFNNINSLQTEDAPKIMRFLNFYLQVVKEQNKKKLTLSKGRFNKVARDHLKNVFKVWEFFNQQQTRMIYDVENDCLQLQNYNKLLFDIASKLDKCLMLVIACGFCLNDLLHEPVDNQYVQVLKQILKKLKFFIHCVEQLEKVDCTYQVRFQFHEIFESQLKSILKHLNELQFQEALLFHKNLGEYIHTIAQIIFRDELHILKVKKLVIFSMYQIVTTTIYNQGNQDQCSNQNRDGRIGLLISPMKFKNFEPQLAEASKQYRQVLEMPDPNSKDEEMQNRQDGARQLIQLLFQKYLPLQNLEQWKEEPETFIELEDDNYLMLEYDMDAEMTLSLLSYQLINKLIENFYSTTFPFIQNTLLQSYFTGNIKLGSELEEDALLSIVCMLGKIQKDNKIPKDQQLDVCFVLEMIKTNKWDNILFQRRYIHILIQWVKLIPKSKFVHYYNFVLENLQNTTDAVLIYEQCSCIHKMLQEIDYWLKMSSNMTGGFHQKFIVGANMFGSSTLRRQAKSDLIDFSNDQNQVESQDDQIEMSQMIHSNMIDYLKTFQIVCTKLVQLFHSFTSPNIVWKMINILSFILEKNSESDQQLIECLNQLNINKLLHLNAEQVNEALIDMLKQLLAHQPSSPIILEMCVALLDHCLTKTQHIDDTITFWVFTMRVTANDNPSKISLKNLFMKFCVSYGSVKKEHLFIEFLKVAQECALIDGFNSQQQIVQVLDFAYQKFQLEIENENQLFKLRDQKRAQINYQNVIRKTQTELTEDDDDAFGGAGSFIYEKKLNILHIAHIIFWKAVNEKSIKLQDITLVGHDAVGFILESQKKFILLATTYLTQSRVKRTSPTSSSFFTNLITYIDRVIITDKTWFLNQILGEMHKDNQIQNFDQFVNQWFSKMDFIASRESTRINLIAIYTLLPHFSIEMIKKHFREIGKLTFSQLENYLYLKLTNNSSRFHSPTQMNSDKCTFPYGGTGALQQKNVRLIIQYAEKMSQRMDLLKKDDPTLQYDLIDCFNDAMQKLKSNQGWSNLEPLSEYLTCSTQNILGDESNQTQIDQTLKQQFNDLITNQHQSLKNQMQFNQ